MPLCLDLDQTGNAVRAPKLGRLITNLIQLKKHQLFASSFDLVLVLIRCNLWLQSDVLAT